MSTKTPARGRTSRVRSSPGQRILVAMSGGVDSSLAAALLVEEGHEVIGATMKTFCYVGTPGHDKTCCGLGGIQDARSVARALGIPHRVWDVEEEFTRDVIDDFVGEYARGRTPNPCVRCNSHTKFRDLLTRGRELGCDAIATGHYVRLELNGEGGEPALLRGIDRSKDQSYFLWGLPPEVLPRLRFPVGELQKEEVRERARALGLATAEKPESQEICFVPTGDYRDLLRDRLGERHPGLEPGPIVRTDGTVLGSHPGYAGFTIGQRRGLGGGHDEPLYVVEIRSETREVVVGSEEEVFASGVEVSELSWLVETPPLPGEEVDVQLRYRALPVRARVRETPGSDTPDPALRLDLVQPQRAVTPGQSAVFYRGDRVLGGGRIVRALGRDHSSGLAEAKSSSSSAPSADSIRASASDRSPSNSTNRGRSARSASDRKTILAGAENP